MPLAGSPSKSLLLRSDGVVKGAIKTKIAEAGLLLTSLLDHRSLAAILLFLRGAQSEASKAALPEKDKETCAWRPRSPRADARRAHDLERWRPGIRRIKMSNAEEGTREKCQRG